MFKLFGKSGQKKPVKRPAKKTEEELAKSLRAKPSVQAVTEEECKSKHDSVDTCEEGMNNNEATIDNEGTVNGATGGQSGESCAESEYVINPILEEFLDAPTYEDKLGVFYRIRGTQDKSLLSNIAMALEIELTKEEADDQYAEILYCLKTMEKFECNRLRR